MRLANRLSVVVPALLGALLLAACESESTPVGPEVIVDPSINRVVTTAPINTSNTDTLVMFSFTTGTVVPRTADWDIALRRYEVRLNSAATAGPTAKGVTAVSLGNNRLLSNDAILALTVENTLPAFDALRVESIPADTAFRGDQLTENRTAYLNLAGAPTANAAAYWKVKTANGGYAAVRVSGIAMSAANALQTITIETRVQSGATLGAAQTLTATLGTTPVSVNLATNATVTPNGCNWDLQVNPTTFAVTTNSACGTGTFPGGSAPTFANVTAANDAPQYGAFLASLASPIPNSISDVNAPFRYNLLGTNRLHPMFNTYLVKSGARVYKLQVINYYSEAGASGWQTLRYARIK